MTGPSEESAPGHPEQAEKQPEASLFAEDRTDSHPHPEPSAAFDAQPTQAVAPPPNPAVSGPHQVPPGDRRGPHQVNPAVSGPHQVPPGYGYDQNLPPLQPQYAQGQYPQQPQQQASGLPQPQGGRHAAPPQRPRPRPLDRAPGQAGQAAPAVRLAQGRLLGSGQADQPRREPGGHPAAAT